MHVVDWCRTGKFSSSYCDGPVGVDVDLGRCATVLQDIQLTQRLNGLISSVTTLIVDGMGIANEQVERIHSICFREISLTDRD